MKRSALSRTVVGAVAALLAAACDPGFGIRATGMLRPAPARGCVAASLTASPLVSRVATVSPASNERREGTHRFTVTFRDVGDDDTGYFREQAKGDSVSILTVEFLWLGGIDAVPADDRARMATAATGLLDALKAACAPRSTADVQCREYGPRADGPCRIALH